MGGESRGEERGSCLILCHGKALRCCWRQNKVLGSSKDRHSRKLRRSYVKRTESKGEFFSVCVRTASCWCFCWYKHWCSSKITCLHLIQITVILKWCAVDVRTFLKSGWHVCINSYSQCMCVWMCVFQSEHCQNFAAVLKESCWDTKWILSQHRLSFTQHESIYLPSVATRYLKKLLSLAISQTVYMPVCLWSAQPCWPVVWLMQ